MRLRYLLILLFLAGCSDKDFCIDDRTRSDLDYCNCNPKECQPSDYQPIDWDSM